MEEQLLQRLYSNIGKIITSSLELQVILESIMKEVHFFLQPDNWSLLRLDHETGELFRLTHHRFESSVSISSTLCEDAQSELDAGQRGGQLVRDISKEALAAVDEPLQLGGHVVNGAAQPADLVRA